MSDTTTKALFGTAGCCEDFFDSGNKSALTAPKWLADNGLDCFEYQCGRGVKISDDAAYDFGRFGATIRYCPVRTFAVLYKLVVRR